MSSPLGDALNVAHQGADVDWLLQPGIETERLGFGGRCAIPDGDDGDFQAGGQGL